MTSDSSSPPSRVRLDQWKPGNLDRGRGACVEALWVLVKCAFFLGPFPWPSCLRVALLRLFGARVGRGVVNKPQVHIYFPWKLEIGDHTWIGYEVFLYNVDRITIGSHCCLSQRAFLCTGNHNYKLPTMDDINAPITVCDGAWIGAQTFVGPGVTVGVDAVVAAGSVVTKDLPAGMVCSGHLCAAVKKRWDTAGDRTNDH